ARPPPPPPPRPPHPPRPTPPVGAPPPRTTRATRRALVHRRCRPARDVGGRVPAQKSANEGFGLRVGFRSLGNGHTLWLREESLENETLTFAPPAPEEIAFVEAVGRGDVAKLDELGGDKTPEQLNGPILGRFMTPMNLAVEMEQPASFEWLMNHGAAPPKER
ncbi:MAG: hypothetical protein KY468_11105, partial [Armatimonadetes bacterium]|nr:hypothetical protein [Armatimonadota bacterium]